MPYTTYANQKSIRIHKPAVSRDFLQIDNKEWMAVNKQLKERGFILAGGGAAICCRSPYTLTSEEVSELLKAVDEILTEMEK